MDVRMKIGWKAGEIVDVRDAEARQMIKDGRATDPRDEDQARIAQIEAEDQARIAKLQPAENKARKARKG